MVPLVFYYLIWLIQLSVAYTQSLCVKPQSSEIKVLQQFESGSDGPDETCSTLFEISQFNIRIQYNTYWDKLKLKSSRCEVPSRFNIKTSLTLLGESEEWKALLHYQHEKNPLSSLNVISQKQTAEFEISSDYLKVGSLFQNDGYIDLISILDIFIKAKNLRIKLFFDRSKTFNYHCHGQLVASSIYQDCSEPISSLPSSDSLHTLTTTATVPIPVLTATTQAEEETETILTSTVAATDTNPSTSTATVSTTTDSVDNFFPSATNSPSPIVTKIPLDEIGKILSENEAFGANQSTLSSNFASKLYPTISPLLYSMISVVVFVLFQ